MRICLTVLCLFVFVVGCRTSGGDGGSAVLDEDEELGERVAPDPDYWVRKRGSTGFERPPYVAHIRLKSNNKKLGLIGMHSRPTAARTEANWLDDIARYVMENQGIKDVVIFGDLNLSCSYARPSHFANIQLRTDETWRWLIPDDADTNVAESVCAYDRIIVKGPGLAEAKGFISTTDIEHSDHYPIHMEVDGYRIAAYNVMRLGDTKAEKPEVIEEIAEQICANDLTLIQEYIAKTNKALKAMFKGVRDKCGYDYRYDASKHLGRSQNTERYIYFYNKKRIRIDKSYVQDVHKIPEYTNVRKDIIAKCGKKVYATLEDIPEEKCWTPEGDNDRGVPKECCGFQ